MDIALGPVAVSLPALDVDALSQRARIDALVELQRARAWVDASEQRLLAALVEPGELPRRRTVSAEVEAKQYVREEIACALRVSPMTVNDRLHTARTVCDSLPGMFAALEAGEVTMRHVRIVVDAVGSLDAAARAEVDVRVSGSATSQTPMRFRQSVARVVLALDARGAEERHEAAHAQRCVNTRFEPDEMGSLHAVLSAEDLQAVHELIQAAADAHPDRAVECGRTTAARGVAALPDPGCAGCVSRARPAGQRRADALVGLVLGLEPAVVRSRHGRRPAVQVSVALSTLLGLDEQPGELDGYGPIPADVARRVAGDPSGTWRRLVTDDLGRLVDYGRTVYRPPQDLTDHVIARDRTCRFPGCGWQARSCELDHLLDWDLGGASMSTTCCRAVGGIITCATRRAGGSRVTRPESSRGSPRPRTPTPATPDNTPSTPRPPQAAGTATSRSTTPTRRRSERGRCGRSRPHDADSARFQNRSVL